MSPLFDVKPAIEALDALLAYKYPAVDSSPIARTSNSVQRPSRADAVRAILRDIDETRASVTALEQKIKKLVFGLQKQRATVVAILGPVSGLPTELLVEVFRTVVEYDRTSKARITLSHVSSLWRTVALGTKDLWTVIQVPSHAPEMVHEFARRSGNLRLELSTRSLAGWPEDLALTSDEASRLSVLFSHSSPPLTFSASLTKYASLMGLDGLVIAAGGAAHDVNSAMCQVRHVKLDDTKLSGWITMGLLESLTICNSSAGVATEHVTRIMAPRLSQLELSGIRGKNLGDENDNASVANPHWSNLHFEIWGYQDQITAFTLSRSDRSVFLRVLNLWKLPNLVSLTLHFTDLDGSSHEMDTWYLYALVRPTCPAVPYGATTQTSYSRLALRIACYKAFLSRVSQPHFPSTLR